jgi:hypothetical protein
MRNNALPGDPEEQGEIRVGRTAPRSDAGETADMRGSVDAIGARKYDPRRKERSGCGASRG